MRRETMMVVLLKLRLQQSKPEYFTCQYIHLLESVLEGILVKFDENKRFANFKVDF
jgi:hypothetical protein